MSAKQTPTPGPWSWEYHPDFPNFSKVIALHFNERDVLLCTGDGERAWGVIREADARLIAAAPELLKACQMVADMAVSWQPLTPGDISEVNAAISKATGR